MDHTARKCSVAALVAALITSVYADSPGGDYTVVVSKATHNDAEWARA